MDAWGTLRSSSANLIRKACAWVDDPAHLGRLVRWQSAFCRTLMVVLRNDLFTPVSVRTCCGCPGAGSSVPMPP